MSWVDTMRLRRRADKVRMFGWVNLFLSAAWSVVHATDGFFVLAIAAVWAAAVMALSYGIAWAIDKHADRVVKR